MSLLASLNLPNPRAIDTNYYVLLETHISYLRMHPETKVVEVTGQQGEKYIGDFHGLLDTLAIDKKYHYLITRVNNMNSSVDYDGSQLALYVPSISVIAAFIATYDSLED